jgi:hypothetical protein
VSNAKTGIIQQQKIRRKRRTNLILKSIALFAGRIQTIRRQNSPNGILNNL